MRRIIIVALCIMQLCICQAQDKKKIKLWPAKEDKTVVVDSLKARADSLDRLIATKDSLLLSKDSLIQSLYKIPDTLIVYGNDSLKIAQQEEAITKLSASMSSKDSLITTLVNGLCYADSCMVKYAYGLCYEKFDRSNIEEAEQIISRLYQPELKAEMEKDLLVLLKNYEVYYNTFIGILTKAQNDPYREVNAYIDDFKDKYIKEIQRMVYYTKHYRQYWSISYLDELIDEVIKAIESHTRESKVDFSKYIN